MAYEFWIEKKLPKIVNEPNQVYVETTHLFCKGFVESLLDLHIIPDVIILTRSHREVATSLWRLDTIPGRTPKGLKFYLSPDDPNVLSLPNWRTIHDYQLCYWYCLEIERRCLIYEKIFIERGARVAKVSFNNIKKISSFNKLIKQLYLPRLGPVNWLRFLRIRGQTVNPKIQQKRPEEYPANIDFLERQVIDAAKNSKY
jgi:hypothetical protein